MGTRCEVLATMAGRGPDAGTGEAELDDVQQEAEGKRWPMEAWVWVKSRLSSV